MTSTLPRSTPQHLRVLITIVTSAVMLICCKSEDARSHQTVPPKQYQLTGTIVRLEERASRFAVIKHGDIKGWMEAMTMEFPVESAAEFERLKVGDEITATVYVRDLDYWIGNIQQTKPQP
ncbi:MAG: copper-binding protein [Bryobacteraceae bacterium]|nr:copper-binding protein [Bryobacteraceae bacterium]